MAPAGSSALTASQKSATRVAACSSPCASVSAVKPAMSAKTKVASEAVKALLLPSSQLLLVDVEAEHHAAFVVLREVAVRHPELDVGDVAAPRLRQLRPGRSIGAVRHGSPDASSSRASWRPAAIASPMNCGWKKR